MREHIEIHSSTMKNSKTMRELITEVLKAAHSDQSNGLAEHALNGLINSAKTSEHFNQVIGVSIRLLAEDSQEYRSDKSVICDNHYPLIANPDSSLSRQDITPAAEVLGDWLEVNRGEISYGN